MTEKNDTADTSSQTELVKHINELLLENGIDLAGRTITYEGELDEGSWTTIDISLKLLERNGNEPIEIRLMSNGGSTYQATAIIGRIQSSPCDITVSVYGACCSAATLILAGAKHRRMSKYATFMWHQASAELQYDGLEKLKEMVRQISKEESLWCQWMAQFSKKKRTFWNKLAQSGKEHYFSAEECVELGVCDEIF